MQRKAKYVASVERFSLKEDTEVFSCQGRFRSPTFHNKLNVTESNLRCVRTVVVHGCYSEAEKTNLLLSLYPRSEVRLITETKKKRSRKTSAKDQFNEKEGGKGKGLQAKNMRLDSSTFC